MEMEKIRGAIFELANILIKNRGKHMETLDTDDLQQFTDSLGRLVQGGLNNLADAKPEVAKNVFEILQNNRGSLRVTVDMNPLHIEVHLRNIDNESLSLFTLGNVSHH